MEGLERHEGHLLNWYDTQSLAALPPRYVSTVDSGNLAGALMALASGLREAGLAGSRRARLGLRGGHGLPLPATTRSAGSSRSAIGWRTAEGPGRLDPSYYDLLASEARLASFIAIARGELPETHWFHLGRLVTSVGGMPTLLSWSGTAFEYLMPLLVMKSYPQTLLDQTCRMAVRRQVEYAAARDVPWGISECAYNLTDRHGNYQYKAFGVPGLGLKRGLADELVVAPYATALAALVEPQLALATCAGSRATATPAPTATTRRSTTRTPRRASSPKASTTRRPRGTVVRTFMAHHQGMTLVALANVLLGDPMVRRFHADPRVQATELLLQERVPREAAITQPRPVEETRATGPAVAQSRAPLPLAAHAVAACAVPLERQLHHGGDERRRRRQLLPRQGRHASPRGHHPRPGKPVPVPAGRAQRQRVVGDAPPHGRRERGLPGDVPRREGDVQLPPRRHRDPARRGGVDRGRRRGAAARGDEPQRPPARDRDHQLRGDRARLGGGRSRPSRVREAVRRDRVPPRANGAACAAVVRARPTRRRCGPCTS